MKVLFDTKKTCLVIFTLAWLAIGASILFKGWSVTWTALHIPVMSPSVPFEDMRTVQGSLRSVDLGFNPQAINPGDPWSRLMNYPMIWYWIAKFFQLNNETNFILFVCVYILAYLAACFCLLRNSPSLYTLLLAFSWPSLLVVERGNNDLLAFGLLFVGIILSLSYFRAFSILLATVLKIYPVLMVVTLAKKPRLLIALVLIMAAFFILDFRELISVQAGNTALSDPASLFASYGFDTTMRNIQLFFGGPSATPNPVFKYIFILVSFILIAVLSQAKFFHQAGRSTYRTDLFVSGAVIFSGTYLLTSNWDYRLIFLLFCIPYILSIQNKLIKHSMLTGIFLASNAGFLYWGNYSQYIVLLSVAIKYFVFIMVSACLVKEIINVVPVILLKPVQTFFSTISARLHSKNKPWYLKPGWWVLSMILLAALSCFASYAHNFYARRFITHFGTLNLHITGLRPPGNIIINVKADATKNFSQSVYMSFNSAEVTYAVDGLYFGDYVIQVIHDQNNNRIADVDNETGLFLEGFGMANLDKLDLHSAVALKTGSTFDNLKYAFEKDGDTIEIMMYYPPFPWQKK